MHDIETTLVLVGVAFRFFGRGWYNLLRTRHGASAQSGSSAYGSRSAPRQQRTLSVETGKLQFFSNGKQAQTVSACFPFKTRHQPHSQIAVCGTIGFMIMAAPDGGRSGPLSLFRQNRITLRPFSIAIRGGLPAQSSHAGRNIRSG